MLIVVQIMLVTRFSRYRGKLIECNSRYRFQMLQHMDILLYTFLDCTGIYNYGIYNNVILIIEEATIFGNKIFFQNKMSHSFIYFASSNRKHIISVNCIFNATNKRKCLCHK